MFLWFAGLSALAVVLVFQSPAIDYRLVMLGAVAPVLEHIVAGPWVTHTLLWPVAVMTFVMLVFRGRRLVQRRWLGLAIGFFLHLVLDGSWARTSLFWWPGFGTSIRPDDVPALPGLGWLVTMELIGLAVLAWCWRRYGLSDSARLDRFIRTGQLDRGLVGEPKATC